jgi:hypothetical protein
MQITKDSFRSMPKNVDGLFIGLHLGLEDAGWVSVAQVLGQGSAVIPRVTQHPHPEIMTAGLRALTSGECKNERVRANPAYG